MFQITGCERIEVKDLVLDWDCDLDPLASLVKVSGVAPAGESIDIEFLRHTRFPNRSAQMKVLEAVDPATMTVGCEGKSDIYLPDWHDDKTAGATEWLSDNVARLRNVVVRDNIFQDCNKAGIGERGPQVFMTVYLGRTDTPDRKTAYPIFQDVLFERNRFLDCPGSSFFISSARNVVIRDHVLRFRDSQGRGHASDRSKVFVSYASGMHVVNNRWFKSPHVAAPGALVDLSNADEIHWEGNTLVTGGGAIPAGAPDSPG